MKKLALVVAMLALVAYTGQSQASDKRSVREILDAICKVESNGGKVTRDGDNGNAIGPYQIWHDYWKDTGLKGSYNQCRQKEYAEKVVVTYWQVHCPQALERLDYQTLARVHNGGPMGAKRSATLPYWRKVQAALHRAK